MSGFLTDFLLPCVYAVMACLAFCFLLNQRGRLMVVSSLGGGVGGAASPGGSASSAPLPAAIFCNISPGLSPLPSTPRLWLG